MGPICLIAMPLNPPCIACSPVHRRSWPAPASASPPPAARPDDHPPEAYRCRLHQPIAALSNGAIAATQPCTSSTSPRWHFDALRRVAGFPQILKLEPSMHANTSDHTCGLRGLLSGRSRGRLLAHRDRGKVDREQLCRESWTPIGGCMTDF